MNECAKSKFEQKVAKAFTEHAPVSSSPIVVVVVVLF